MCVCVGILGILWNMVKGVLLGVKGRVLINVIGWCECLVVVFVVVF